MTMGQGGIFGNPNIGTGGGIFGSPRKRFGIDALEMGQPMAPPFMGAERMAAPAAPTMQQPAKGDNTRRIIGIIGDALLGLGGQQGVYAPMMERRSAERRQQEQSLAAEQRAMQNQRDLFRFQEQTKAEFAQPEGPEIGLFEDNAGNRFRYDKGTGMPIDEKPIFIDRATRTMIQDGALINVPNPFLGQSGGRAQGGMSEGTVIENDQGQRMILRNGQWQPMGGAASNGGGNFRP
jgi:hypothetical protein